MSEPKTRELLCVRCREKRERHSYFCPAHKIEDDLSRQSDVVELEDGGSGNTDRPMNSVPQTRVRSKCFDISIEMGGDFTV